MVFFYSVLRMTKIDTYVYIYIYIYILLPLGKVPTPRTRGGNLVPSGHFKHSPKANPTIHFDGTGGIRASPNSHFECSGRIGQNLGSRFECCGTSGAS